MNYYAEFDTYYKMLIKIGLKLLSELESTTSGLLNEE
jgi:hypothetical protein